jgi:serine/threonine protein kinase/Tfp pilus assembly protein PilF
MFLTPGNRLGNYEICARVGAGGMGEVYRARDLRLGREVALKVLAPGLAAHPASLERLEREARAVAALSHPNIVVLHSIEEDGDIRFLTMELLDGKTLDIVIAAGELPPSRVLALAIPMAEALAAAHARGVVHRDVKPGNVMVTSEDRVKVLDFGLAKTAGAGFLGSADSTAATIPADPTAGHIVGTVAYMAPEQVRGHPADARTDLFAFGITIYEMATGRRPFGGATAADVASSILRDTPEPIRARRPDMPDDLDRIVGRCLAKDPHVRYASAAEVAAELRAVQEALEVGRSAGGHEVIRSLVVLPLENVSRDPTQEYFADGMTEALISDLARLENLRVISRTSAMKYKGAAKALPEIAQELNVDAVIEGSALLVGTRVRISVQLVSARRDQTLWSDRYERDLEDVLKLQNDVAGAVAREIELRLTPREAKRLARRRDVHPAAHLEYLKGQYIGGGSSPQAVELSQRHYQRALELDPTFAPAWAGLASCHFARAARGMAPPAEAVAEARTAAYRALALDESEARAYAVLGTIQAHELDLPEAVQMLQRALDLNPGLIGPLRSLGRVYYCTERHAEAQEAMLRALSLDPLSMITHTGVGDAYYYARKYGKSLEYYRRAIVLDSRFDGAHTDLARSLEALDRFDEAQAEYEEGRRLAGSVALPSFGLAHLEARRGNQAAARRILEELTAARSRRVVSAWGIAALHACLGDVDDAFRWLDSAVTEHATGLIFLRVHPRLDGIRCDPRYPQLLHRLGLDRA